MTEQARAGHGRPLDGLRIIEVSSYVAAPLCGLVLQQLGAEVIRVEPIGGAPDRTRWPLAASGTSLYWSGLNKGKQAIEVDLRSAQGRALVAGLVVEGGRGGGILVTNADSGPELRYEALKERRADVIHARLSGLRDGTPAVDYTVQATSGFPLVTGPRGSAEPVNQVVPAWDIAAGLYLTTGLLAADRRRCLTGEGAQISVALEDVALSTAGHLGYLADAQLGGGQRLRDGNHVYGSFGHDFATADGQRLMVVALTRRHWEQLLEVTGLRAAVSAVEQALEVDLGEESARFTHRDLLVGLLAPWFAARTLGEASEHLRQTRVLWSRYRSFDEVAGAGGRHLAENPLFAPLHQDGVGSHFAPGSPLVVDGHQSRPRPAPRVGQHTEEVLRGLASNDRRRAP
jgi:2-methylfumaryl-CoA isomerase